MITSSKEESMTVQWFSDIKELEEELKLIKHNRNYYEGLRKKTQKKLDVLLANDPRQMKLELDNEA